MRRRTVVALVGTPPEGGSVGVAFAPVCRPNARVVMSCRGYLVSHLALGAFSLYFSHSF